MNISEAAVRSGVPAKTIRYYESVGLIAAAPRAGNGYRDYADPDVETLRFIARARSLGFAVDAVSELLALYRDKRRASADVKAITERHIFAIERKIAELGSLRLTLKHLADHCHGDDRPECPILAQLERGYAGTLTDTELMRLLRRFRHADAEVPRGPPTGGRWRRAKGRG